MKSIVSVTADSFPPIPEAVTSFGSAIAGDALYLYGGHLGNAHEYCSETQANTLWQLDLQRPDSWRSLGKGPRLQGLAMVSFERKLYRIGGFTANNRAGEENDLWSQTGVACYDPNRNTWTDLPPLPEPRSSFDAAVVDGRIYVVGGWSMCGTDEARWLTSASVLDLKSETLRWQELPDPPFQRRALSAASHGGKLYAMGGMQEKGGPTTQVSCFDPESQEWLGGPDLVGEAMEGFGIASFAAGDALYASTYSGTLQRLCRDAENWEVLCKLERDRFFHRLLCLSENQLLAFGGASKSSGKFEEIDLIEIR